MSMSSKITMMMPMMTAAAMASMVMEEMTMQRRIGA